MIGDLIRTFFRWTKAIPRQGPDGYPPCYIALEEMNGRMSIVLRREPYVIENNLDTIYGPTSKTACENYYAENMFRLHKEYLDEEI